MYYIGSVYYKNISYFSRSVCFTDILNLDNESAGRNP